MKPTERELIKQLREMLPEKVDYAEIVGAPEWAYGCRFVYEDPECYTIEVAADALENLLSELEGRVMVHGWWEETDLGYRCSVCNKQYITSTALSTLKYKYCPYCGAKLDKEEYDAAD